MVHRDALSSVVIGEILVRAVNMSAKLLCIPRRDAGQEERANLRVSDHQKPSKIFSHAGSACFSLWAVFRPRSIKSRLEKARYRSIPKVSVLRISAETSHFNKLHFNTREFNAEISLSETIYDFKAAIASAGNMTFTYCGPNRLQA